MGPKEVATPGAIGRRMAVASAAQLRREVEVAREQVRN